MQVKVEITSTHDKEVADFVKVLIASGYTLIEATRDTVPYNVFDDSDLGMLNRLLRESFTAILIRETSNRYYEEAVRDVSGTLQIGETRTGRYDPEKKVK